MPREKTEFTLRKSNLNKNLNVKQELSVYNCEMFSRIGPVMLGTACVEFNVKCNVVLADS